MGVFLYDGDCGFCSRCAEFLVRQVRPRARVVAWQRAGIESLGLTAAECSAAVQWVGDDGGRGAGPVAIAAVLRASEGGVWRWLGRVLGQRAISGLAWPIYNLVARHRHQLPGGTATCAIPQN